MPTAVGSLFRNRRPSIMNIAFVTINVVSVVPPSTLRRPLGSGWSCLS